MKKIITLGLFYFLSATQVLADEFVIIPDDKRLDGCNFTKGEIELKCIPNYLKYLIEALVAIAGTIAVIFIMVGGFKYIFGGMSEDKEAGKETIIHAIIGLVIVGLAWIAVTALISIITM